jgi:PilZ domain
MMSPLPYSFVMAVNKQSATELRARRNRFSIMAPASFSWRSQDGVMHRAEGVTLDISAHGLLISTHQTPTVGTVIEVEVSIPSSESNGAIVCLKGKGIVVRTDSTDEQTPCFAAAVKFALADIQASSNHDPDR